MKRFLLSERIRKAPPMLTIEPYCARRINRWQAVRKHASPCWYPWWC
jgi:hypothetical protein